MNGKSGWVPSNAVRFRIQSARGFDAPRATANKVVDFNGDWASDLGDIRNVVACDGHWVFVYLQVKYRRDGGRLIELGNDKRPTYHAWFRGVCGNEETTCDMAPVDVDP